jgi:hypothetical protein
MGFELGAVAWGRALEHVVCSSKRVVYLGCNRGEVLPGTTQAIKHERLNELLDVINDEGMGDVNKLYGKILEITYSAETNTKAQNEWEHEKFRWIVGFIIMLKEPLPIGDIGALLDLRRTPKSNPVDILHFVTNLRTVLVAGTGNISNEHDSPSP